MTAFLTDFYNTNGVSPQAASVPATASGGAPGGTAGPSALGLNLGGSVNTKVTADGLTVLTVLGMLGFVYFLLHIA